MTARTRHPRAGFTLVELLVAMALIVLIMSILSEAFVQSLGTFRATKGIGDMQENLRSVVLPLRTDLVQHHFEAQKKLSTLNQSRPTEGFFRIKHGTYPVNEVGPPFPFNYELEGQDYDNIRSFRAVDTVLHFTTRQTGNRQGDWLSTVFSGNGMSAASVNALQSQGPVPYRSPGTVIGQSAEVVWFLQRMYEPSLGVPLFAGSGTVPLYTLRRRHKILIESNTDLNITNRVPSGLIGLLPEVAARPDLGAASGSLFFPNMADITDPNRRSFTIPTVPPLRLPLTFPMGTGAEATAFANDPIISQYYQINDDIVISDVISFEVTVLLPGQFDFNAVPGGDYDTANWPGTNNDFGIRAIKVTLRVWDAKTEQARQVTMIQDM